MKIGILINKFDTLQNWELRIIEKIKNEPNLELSLLIKDERDKEDNRIFKNSLNEFLLDKQLSLEKKRYLNNLQSVNKTEIIKYLNTVPILELRPKQNGNLDIFSQEDSQKIKKYNLDVLLKHAFNTISGELLSSAKHGIWFLSHSSISLRKGGFPGFWEVLLKKPVVSASLIQLSSEENKGNIIDKGHFNRDVASAVITNDIIKKSSISLLFKNLKQILNNDIEIREKVNLTNQSKSPNFYYSSKYIIKFYINYIKNKIGTFFTSSNTRYKCWNLFIGNGNFLDADLSGISPIKPPKDEFWADPFLFKREEQYYVFFENYSYKTKRGKISCGRIKDNKLIDILDILDLDYHLSYPFIFEEDDNIFMMPETNQNKRLEIYKCIHFPNKWELYSTAFEGKAIVDTTLFIDKKEQKWLFINKPSGQSSVFDNELYIYKIDSLKLEVLEPHKQNPIIIDSRVARNGGAIFEYQNKFYRPSQNCTDGVYGRALNINQIEKLTIDEYIEKNIKKIEPDFQKGLMSIHHLHQIEDMFVFDAAFKKL